MAECYYRFEDDLVGTGGFDIDGDYIPGPSYVRVRVLTYEIAKRTPKGAWVRHPSPVDGSMQTYLILDHWHKKHANPTLEGARQDFIARKQRLIDVQTRRIKNAQEAIDLAKNNKERSFYGREIQVDAA